MKTRACQIFPEYSHEWIVDEFDTLETRSADPFHISEETKKIIAEVSEYWKGKTTSELAFSYMTDETIASMEHNIFTPGNYLYNGIGHVSVNYSKVLNKGYKGIIQEAAEELASCDITDANYPKKREFLESVIISCQAAIDYAKRYSALAEQMAAEEKDFSRKQELLTIAKNCKNVPENPASTFMEACQSFWFVQLLIQTESNGHSISPGRFDQYMYPFYKRDLDKGAITPEEAQELVDCVWVKLNDFSKIRDAASAEGFAGYSLFQNLCAGGQTPEGLDATNDMSYMCIRAYGMVLRMNLYINVPSLQEQVWAYRLTTMTR